MEQYTVLTKAINEITSNNKFTDTLVYSYIKSRENYTTHSIEITQPEIANKLNIKERTINDVIPRIKSIRSLFTKVNSNTRNENGEVKTRNTYHFATTYKDFFYIHNSFFKEKYECLSNEDTTKVKGFLLQLKAVCLNNTNKYISSRPFKKSLNKSELANRLAIDTKTLVLLLSKAEQAGKIKYISNGILITDKHIIPDNIKDSQYHLIYNWCIEHNTIPPDNDKKQLSKIAAKYHITNKTIEEAAKAHNITTDEYISIASSNIDKYPLIKNYLPYTLSNRITKVPEYITFDYLLKVLNIDDVVTNKPIQCNIIM